MSIREPSRIKTTNRNEAEFDYPPSFTISQYSPKAQQPPLLDLLPLNPSLLSGQSLRAIQIISPASDLLPKLCCLLFLLIGTQQVGQPLQLGSCQHSR